MDIPWILWQSRDGWLELIERAGATGAQMLLSWKSSYSLVALGLTLSLAAAVVLKKRLKRGVRLAVLVHGLFPRRLWQSASGRTDAAFMAFNIILGMSLFGWAIISHVVFASWTSHALSRLLGAGSVLPAPSAVIAAATTVAVFLAYEFAYWFDHFLSHKVPFLWQFHQVHHSAESLSLMTNFRVHPVDSVVFYNLMGLFTGAVEGLLAYSLGWTDPLGSVETNVLLLAAAVLLTHLQHSHLQIGFGKGWGQVFLSPLHHQIHHSIDLAHHDRNFGNSLALFDRLFGTLYVPGQQRQTLVFGVSGLNYHPHRFKSSLWMPFVDVAKMFCSGQAISVVRPSVSPLDAA